MQKVLTEPHFKAVNKQASLLDNVITYCTLSKGLLFFNQHFEMQI